MLKKTLLTLLTAGLLTGSALAAIQPGAFTLSPLYGGQVFEGNQSLDDAKLWSIGLGYNYSEHFAVEALYGSSDGDAEAEDATTSDTELQHYRVDALYHFMPSSSVVPYLAAGAGMTSYDRAAGNDEDNFVVNYGAGIKWFLLDDLLALRADVRHLIDTDENANNLVYSAGLLFQFGKKTAKPEPIAEEPAPTEEPAPVVAAPPLDSDGDGVIDTKDRCPETPTGVEVDAKGCPLDSDFDRVPDYLDKCPDTARWAPVDKNGCPLDDDHDGVANYLDKCPGTPEGYAVEADGCPAKLTLHINFANDSNVITEEFSGEIAKAAECIRDFPGNLVFIEGHTDSKGSAAYNQQLSERRANAVKNSLTEKYNIPAEKMSAVGYGEEQPVADNTTAEGRAQNRRVEVGCGLAQ